VQSSVQPTVSGAAQVVPRLFDDHQQGRGAVLASVGVAELESVDASGFADDLGCGQRSGTAQRHQSRGRLLDRLSDFPLHVVSRVP
jgi:hypothetical protein